MNKIFATMMLLLLNLNIYAADLTKNEATHLVLSHLSIDSTSCEMYVFDEIKKAGSTIKLLTSQLTIPSYDSWVYFVDDKPFANWGHSCRYVFVNTKTGQLEVQSKNMPPLSENLTPIISQKKSSLGIANISNINKLITKAKTETTSDFQGKHNYAVILSGGANSYNNHVRYWNDCATIYSILVNKYSYLKDHIFVLMSDGTSPNKDRRLLNGTYDSSPLDLDGDGNDDIQYAATKDNLKTVFNHLSSILTEDDNLFIFTIDHGDLIDVSKKSSSIILWNGEYISDNEFATEVNKVKAGCVNIVMGQCYSGGFIDDLSGKNRLIATACDYNEPSYSTSNYEYDEFVYHWSAAVLGKYPNGKTADADYNSDGAISIQEAFHYAASRDKQKEHPQKDFTPTSLATNTTMAASSCDLSIIGPDYVYDIANYSMAHLHDNYTVRWSISGYNSLPFPTLSEDTISHTCTITNKIFYPYTMVLTANVYNNGKLYRTLTKNVESLRSYSSYKATYQQESCPYYNVIHPAIPETTASENTAYFVHQGCQVNLKSDIFKYCSISSYDGIEPEYIFQNSKSIYFVLPLGSGGRPFNLYIKTKDGKKTYHYLFFSASNNANLKTASKLSLNSNSKTLNISIESEAESSIGDDWQIEIYSTTSGDLKTKAQTSDNTTQINTSNWKSGVYVVRASSKSEVLSDKVFIK